MRRRNKGKVIAITSISVVIIGALLAFLLLVILKKPVLPVKSPDEVLQDYMKSLASGDYSEMYAMLAEESQLSINEEDFITRHENIYKGIEASDIAIEIQKITEPEEGNTVIDYEMSLNTLAGNITFPNEAELLLIELEKSKEYKLIWNDRLIFPNLGKEDKVRVSTDKAVRGQIYDRNGKMLAGRGEAASVGLVPGKLGENSDENLTKLAELLGISRESIDKKLSAKWVREDSFVPLKTIKKVDELNLNSVEPREENLQNKAFQDQLLTIPGVMIGTAEVRSYPMGAAAAHLIGYVQTVTAEDLEKHAGEDYLSDSVIGRSGMETLYEKELKGTNGYRISIIDPTGSIKENVAVKVKVDGEDVMLTIDSELQSMIYNEFAQDKSCTVAMNPYTGEVLALVSTPSYDDNDFILGMSEVMWSSLNEDERKPMFNRFRQRFAPGSSFKPITGALALAAGTLDPDQDLGSEGLSWKKDESWGNYKVTTLHDYSPVTMENAFIYSDNIYFAKAALGIGYEGFMKGLDQLGFNEELPFEIAVAESQYSNAEKIESEIQLADSGYGQGQVLTNPIHLASLYTVFPNGGNVIKPYLKYKENPEPEIWISQAFSSDIADRINEALVKVVNTEHGTGRAARREDITLAGKTGTAEIKASKGDTSGTELGWFAVYTTDSAIEKPVLLVSMVEDVKEIGGSGYVVRKDKAVLDQYIPLN
jgi:penicillin-binding protein